MGYIYVRVAAAQRNIGDVLVQIRQSDPVRLHKGLQVLANPKDLVLNYLDASGRFTGMPCRGPWPIGPIVQTQHTIIEKLGE